MDDPLIALGAAVATALMILANWLLGGWRHARLGDPAAARARYAEDFWEDRLGAVALDEDGRTALIEIENAPAVGLVVAMGDKLVTRRLTPGLVRSVDSPDDRSLRIRLDDFVLPEIRLTLEAETSARWRDRLLRLRKKGAAADAA